MANQQSPTRSAAGSNVAASTNSGLQKFDINVASSMSTPVRIELFNFDYSQFETFNPAVQTGVQFHPMSAGNPILIPHANVSNGFYLTYVVGKADAYVNGSTPYTPTGNTTSVCHWDEFGNAIYAPGYQAGVLDQGIITISGQQTAYRNMFKALGKYSMTINYIKVTVQTNNQNQLQQPFTYVQNNITGEGMNGTFNPSTYQNENVQQLNIITVPVNRKINHNTGLWYPILAANADNSGTVTFTTTISVFFTTTSKALLQLV